MKSDPKLRARHVTGFFVLVFLGTLFHFVYDWSGSNPMIAWIFPVNESVWEHLKLGPWAVIVYAAFEFIVLKFRPNNFLAGKAVGMVVLNLTILVIYYMYTTLAGRNILWLDISSFVIGAALCQVTAFRFSLSENKTNWNIVGGLSILFLIIAFAFFTVYPAQQNIFKDQNTGIYGIPVR
jgi:hypothetical protein